MKIINVSSKICLTDFQINFIKDILINGNEREMHRYYYDRCDTLPALVERVPVFLLNEYDFDIESKRLEIEFDIESKRLEIENERYAFPITEFLGLYMRDNRSFFKKTPVILICLDRIMKSAKSEKNFLYLTTKVIIHEFAHALFDIENYNALYGKNDEFFTWMEESMANAFTLSTLEFYYERRYRRNYCCEYFCDTEIIDYAKNFIKYQPPKYSLGLEIFEKHLDRYYWKWQRYKKELVNKNTKEKSDWLKYVKQNYRQVDRNKLDKLYEKLFDIK